MTVQALIPTRTLVPGSMTRAGSGIGGRHTFTGRLAVDGETVECGHAHRTKQAAWDCTFKMLRAARREETR